MEAPSQFCYGVHLKILPIILEVFLRHFSYWRRKAFHEDGYDKIDELSNFRCNPVSHFNKLRDTSNNLGSKETFLSTWNPLLNNNGTLNIQFNYLLFLCNASE